LQGSGGKRAFKEYLDSLGLSEKPMKMTKKQKKKLAKQGFENAQRILKMHIKKKKR